MPKQRRKVLVVDDEELILEQLVMAFEDAGFDVATATTASAARTVLNDSAPISLVVTDIRMPGSVDGLMFGHMVAEIYPDIPIIIISGVSAPDDRDVPAGATFVAKPFKPALLVDEAKLLLNRG
jgi:DNA-binding NtrC family response regulator